MLLHRKCRSRTSRASSRIYGEVLNRGWGESPESSVELLGGWEESAARLKQSPSKGAEGVQGLGNTELFGFPGLLFEVLKNDTVSCLTVYCDVP